jgi:hypothetical protein
MTRAKRRAWEDSMGDTGTFFWTPGDTPPLWDPFAALSILDVCKKLQVHLSSAQPLTREHLLVIFFHETGFSNIKQGMGTGPAVGFGQMEIFNLDKIPFFKWLPAGFDSITHNPKIHPAKKKAALAENGIPPAFEKLTDGRVTSDNDFAIRMHCKYFEWLATEKGKRTVDGALAAQTGGGNEHFIGEFRDGAIALDKAIASGKRTEIISALNEIRWYFAGPKGPPPGARTKQSKSGRTLVHNPIALQRFPKYWDFTLPESDVPLIARK